MQNQRTRCIEMGGGKVLIFSIKNALVHPCCVTSFLFWFRVAQNCTKFRRITSRLCASIGKKRQVFIPTTTRIGFGLYLGHFTSIVINEGTIIGNNCNLSHFVSIGSNSGLGATIGNNVYIGPNVSIVEDVKIGNNVTIGAGAVVTKDIPDGATAVGVPASPINSVFPARFIKNKYTSL